MQKFGLPYTWITGYVSPPASRTCLSLGCNPSWIQTADLQDQRRWWNHYTNPKPLVEDFTRGLLARLSQAVAAGNKCEAIKRAASRRDTGRKIILVTGKRRGKVNDLLVMLSPLVTHWKSSTARPFFRPISYHRLPLLPWRRKKGNSRSFLCLPFFVDVRVPFDV